MIRSKIDFKVVMCSLTCFRLHKLGWKYCVLLYSKKSWLSAGEISLVRDAEQREGEWVGLRNSVIFLHASGEGVGVEGRNQ